MQSRFSSALSAAVATLMASGCGLVDSDVTRFDISLSPKNVTVDTAQWMLSGSGGFPAVDCSGDPSICTQSADSFCSSSDCSASCDGENCQLTVSVNLFKDFNLKNENPALQDLDDMALISVSVSRVFYEVPNNTLNVDLPALDVYIAPVTVMTPGDGAEHFATIPPLTAGEMVAEGEIEMAPGGEDILRSFLEDWTTPFNIIVATDVTVSAGDPIPMGMLDAVVRVNASAGLN